MAEAVFIQKIRDRGIEDQFRVDSAGLGDWHVGQWPDRRTIQVLSEHSIQPASRARQIRKQDFTEFDYIIAMDDQNIVGLHAWTGSNPQRVSLMMSWAEMAPRHDVPDPYHGSMRDFEEVFELVDAACDGLIGQILRT